MRLYFKIMILRWDRLKQHSPLRLAAQVIKKLCFLTYSNRKGSKGFSLLEHAISLAVISMLGCSVTIFSINNFSQHKTDITLRNIALINDSIVAYFYNNAVNGVTNLSSLPCPNAQEIIPSLKKASGCKISDELKLKDGFYYGAVPVKALELAPEFMFDGWGNKFIFAVNGNINNMNHDAYIYKIISDSDPNKEPITIQKTFTELKYNLAGNITLNKAFCYITAHTTAVKENCQRLKNIIQLLCA